MAIKVAPVQGWGVYWNAAHPDQPFTPVVVDLAAPGGTAGPQAGAPTAGSSAPSQLTQLIAPVAGLTAATPLSGAQPEDSHSSTDSNLAETSALSSLNQSHGDDRWFIVPSAENDGQGGFDVAAGDFSADWLIA